MFNMNVSPKLHKVIDMYDRLGERGDYYYNFI